MEKDGTGWEVTCIVRGAEMRRMGAGGGYEKWMIGGDCRMRWRIMAEM
jgi:hypothetical protein